MACDHLVNLAHVVMHFDQLAQGLDALESRRSKFMLHAHLYANVLLNIQFLGSRDRVEHEHDCLCVALWCAHRFECRDGERCSQC